MAIRWKVVTNNRKSFMANELPKKFRLSYLKGEIVKAPKDSLGIMVFETKSHAERFFEQEFCIDGEKILRVESIGRGRNGIFKISMFASEVLYFYKMLPGDIFTRDAPIGTICYDAVKVID